MTADATVRPARRSAAQELLASVTTVLAKDVRSRFRGRRAYIVLTIYLGVLALIAYGAYAVQAPVAREQAQFGGGEFGMVGVPNASARVGQAIFTVLSLFQLLLACLIAPALTAGAISLEREKQTLDMLIATPMRPAGLVIGKLLSALAFVILTLLAGIPISAMVLMYGGASVDDILRQQAVLFSSAIGCGVIGLFYSALTKKTQTATVLTYATIIALGIGTLLVFRLWTAMLTNDPRNTFGEVRRAPEALLYVNPAVAISEVLANTELEYGDFSELMDQIRGQRGALPSVPVDGGFGVPGDDAGGIPPDVGQPRDIASSELVSDHFWPRITATVLLISLILTLVSTRLLGPAGRRFWSRPRRARASAHA
ncbi:MAG TPA: ABC transporter permease subunit [Candidatus Limnocylindria bacterium]|jgi:ABC-type transport system involved in multi-copper enzyme maturation permease subunit